MADEIIAHPTYMEHIRHFFDEIDLDHMNGQGVDLSTYALLSARANDVYLHTLQPDGDMPPDDDRKWSAERSASFLNWINDGMPIGIPSPAAVQTTAAARIRKDAASLTADEVTTLAQAFQGLIDRDPADPQSYFALAGQHWFPPPNECKHHNDLYLPWHRVFVRRFEDALRSVPGCADVTLPYWDITTEPPDFLFAPPFAAYTSPVEIMAPQYPAGYTTSRFDAPDDRTAGHDERHPADHRRRTDEVPVGHAHPRDLGRPRHRPPVVRAEHVDPGRRRLRPDFLVLPRQLGPPLVGVATDHAGDDLLDLPQHDLRQPRLPAATAQHPGAVHRDRRHDDRPDRDGRRLRRSRRAAARPAGRAGRGVRQPRRRDATCGSRTHPRSR